MQVSHPYAPEYRLNKRQSDMLVLSLRYTSPIILSDAWHIYLRLTIIVVYYPELPERQEIVYSHGRLGGKE